MSFRIRLGGKCLGLLWSDTQYDSKEEGREGGREEKMAEGGEKEQD